MKQFDVIIIGAGPAGLRCAEVLQNSDLSVLLVEKNDTIGDKVCAGGITRKFFRIYNPPEEVLEFKSQVAELRASKTHFNLESKTPFIFTINRKKLGQWQANRIQAANVIVKTGTQVTAINKKSIEINRETRYGYRYLVGADGANSIVRRYLKLPSKRRIITFQYYLPRKGNEKFQFYFNSNLFKVGYAWLFPHKTHFSVGCGANIDSLSPKVLKENFHYWLKEKEIDPSGAKLESFPILYDYRGSRFENIFLAGEAAGFTTGLTGEGIYPALVSGGAIGDIIQYEMRTSKEIDYLIHFKKPKERYLSLMRFSGPFRNVLLNSTIRMLNNKNFNRKVLNGFS